MRCKQASVTAFFAMALLGGCSNKPTAPTDSVAIGPNDGCTSKVVDYLIGKRLTPELIKQAQQRSGAQTVRQLKPSDMVTLEYRSDRLNLNTDSNGVLLRANCG